MNYRRAIIISIVTYIGTIIVGLTISFSLGIELNMTVPPSPTLLLVSMTLATVLTAFGAIWYFHSNRVRSGAGQGLAFGFIATIVGFALDGILFLALLPSDTDPFQFFREAYTFWFFGVMLAVVFILTTIIGQVSLKIKRDS